MVCYYVWFNFFRRLTPIFVFFFADLIFKNQADKDNARGGQFVNDLLRTEFHK